MFKKILILIILFIIFWPLFEIVTRSIFWLITWCKNDCYFDGLISICIWLFIELVLLIILCFWFDYISYKIWKYSNASKILTIFLILIWLYFIYNYNYSILIDKFI